MDKQTNTAVAFIAGLALGFGIAWLIWSDKGEEIRDEVSDFASRARQGFTGGMRAHEGEESPEDMMGI